MVCSYSLPVRVYKYPFELVMAAYERRFPRCPQMPIVLDCVIIDEDRTEDGSYEKTSRRCKLSVDAPYLFKKIIGIEVAFFMQINVLDRRNRTLDIEAFNETFSSRIKIKEHCRYFAHPENPDWTCFDQSTDLDIQNFFGFEKSMEKMGMKQYAATTLKGKEIIEYFITELRNEGITHVDRWQEPVKHEANNTSSSNETPASTISTPSSEIVNSESSIVGDDHEYIKRNIGQIPAVQEAKLFELRKMLQDCDVENIPPSLSILYRFLRSRDFNLDKTIQILKDSLLWRRENNVDTIINEYQVNNVITKYFPGGWHHYDKEGKPLYILRLGCMDVKGILKSIGEDGLIKLTIHICEEGLRLMEESMKHRNVPVWSWCLLIDLDGLSMRHLWRPGIKALLKLIEIVENNYPETMGRVLIVRAPRVFPILWTVVSAFIDEKTKSKFLFYGGPDCLNIKDGLEHYIETDIIPDFLGGNCKTLIENGGLVPKALYKTDDNENASSSLHYDQNVYRTAEIKSGEFLEIIIKNDDPKSVLTWDFDVLNSDIHFTVYRCSQELLSPSKDQCKSVLDISSLKEGKNYYRVEPSLVCHHSESVQGSHVLTTSDTYVLQWLCPPSCNETAQLMFFYEKLSSADYKGSMTSLQSSFSALSFGSNQSR